MWWLIGAIVVIAISIFLKYVFSNDSSSDSKSSKRKGPFGKGIGTIGIRKFPGKW
jgi:hypothetical protein